MQRAEAHFRPIIANFAGANSSTASGKQAVVGFKEAKLLIEWAQLVMRFFAWLQSRIIDFKYYSLWIDSIIAIYSSHLS